MAFFLVIFKKNNTFFAFFLQKSLQIKKIALPLHSQSGNTESNK